MQDFRGHYIKLLSFPGDVTIYYYVNCKLNRTLPIKQAFIFFNMWSFFCPHKCIFRFWSPQHEYYLDYIHINNVCMAMALLVSLASQLSLAKSNYNLYLNTNSPQSGSTKMSPLSKKCPHSSGLKPSGSHKDSCTSTDIHTNLDLG